MLTVARSNLLDALLPRDLINKIESEELEERFMLVISKLIANIIIGTAKAWEKGEIKKLDPNPGDNGCQIRGYLLDLYFSDVALKEEVSTLKEKFKKIKEVVDRRNIEICNKTRKSPEKTSGLFFKELFGDEVFSKKMEFLIQCYFLAITRVPYERLDNGIILTKTDISRLSKLSSQISILPVEARRKITETVQCNISANSMELLRIEAGKLTSLEMEVKEHILDMLSPENTRIFTPDPKYELKTYGCQLYEYLAVLMGLREAQRLVGIKSIVPPAEKPFWILLQPKEAQAEFSIVSDEAYSEFPFQSSIVVFEGVVNAKYDKDTFSHKIVEIGFTQLILACAAIEPPYERTSDLSTVENTEARAEIRHYREIAEKIECHKEATNPLFILDHVYCNLLANEIGNKL